MSTREEAHAASELHEGIAFIAVGEWFSGEPPDMPIESVFAVSRDNLSSRGISLLDATREVDGARKILTEYAWLARAFMQFQDILDIKVLDLTSPLVNRHYCYYESLAYLREGFITWVNGNVLASMVLLRPFMELSVLHLYWKLYSENSGSYERYYEWLRRGEGRPPFKTAVQYVLGKAEGVQFVRASRVRLLRDHILHLYGRLSSYNHSPILSESVTAVSGTDDVSLEMFLAYPLLVSLVLRQLIFLCILCYPACLIPVDRIRKWGFSGPLGLYFDYCNFAILERAIGSENIQRLVNSLKESPEVDSLISWYMNTPDLSEDEIERTWNEFATSHGIADDVRDMRQRIAFFKAIGRAMLLSTNYVKEEAQQDTHIDDMTIDRIWNRLRQW